MGFRNRWWFAAAVATAAVVGVLIRLAGTGDRTLFWDEAYHLRLVTSGSVTDTLGAALANPPSDPLYALILRAWVGAFGASDFVARLPSVAFAAVTILATAWLALELTRDRRVAVAAAFLVALAPYAVEYGQEASLYSLAAMTTTLALAAGWRWRRTGRRIDAGVFIGLSVVAVYSHYVVAVVLVLVGLLSLTRLGGPRAVSGRQVAICAAVVAVAWLPWLAPMLASWLATDVPRTALPHTATLTELVGALGQYASGTGALLEGVRPLQILGIAAAAVLLARGWLVGRAPGLGGLRVIVISAAVLFIAPWLASLLSGRWLFVAHMLLFVLPAVAVVLAGGALIREPGSTRLSRYVAPVALGLLFVAQIAGLAVNAASPPHGADGSRDLAAALATQRVSRRPGPHHAQRAAADLRALLARATRWSAA